MVKFRHLLAALFICSTLATISALAQSSFTQIRDVVTNPDGTAFNGVVVITWNGYSAPGGTPVSQLSASARIYNGALSVLLVPTTTAAAGTYYLVVYNSSDGTVTWSETWQVPPSTTALTISQVRQSTTEGSSGSGSGTGSTGTTGNYATLPISISQITGLSSDLSSINNSISTLNTEVGSLGATSITALTNTVNGLSTTVTGLSSTVTSLSSTVSTLGTTVSSNSNSLATLNNSVSGLNTTVSSLSTTVSGLNTTVPAISSTVTGLSTSVTTLNSEVASLTAAVSSGSGTGSSTSGPVFVDAALPTGTINGTNATFALASSPFPIASLGIYRNGLLQAQGIDFTLSGTTVTFLSTSIPQVGDIVQAYYRTTGTGPAATFVDAETPGGSINGTNLAFTLANTPNPLLSLKLYKNGLLMSQNGDYTISGSTITFVSAAAPATADVLLAVYRH